jgi:hypothetical protein
LPELTPRLIRSKHVRFAIQKRSKALSQKLSTSGVYKAGMGYITRQGRRTNPGLLNDGLWIEQLIMGNSEHAARVG